MCVMVVVVVVSSHFHVCDGGGSGGGVCVCVCLCLCAWSRCFFIAIAWDETNILVAVDFSMKTFTMCDWGRAVMWSMWSNVGVRPMLGDI